MARSRPPRCPRCASAGPARSPRRSSTPFDRSAALVFFGAIGLLVGPRRRDDRRRGRARAGSRRRLLRRREDARHRGPEPGGSGGPRLVQGHVSASMLVALLFAAAFTGGLVERLIGRRLTGMVGPRAVPALGPRRRRRASGRSGCASRLLLRHAASRSSRSTTARTARTSATRASAACQSSSGEARTPRCSTGSRSTARSRSPR